MGLLYYGDTQKPASLLERILAASSNPGDVVLDPFCGCGTTVEEKKGADKGIDGKILFREKPGEPKPKAIIFSVKGGGTGVKDVRDLRGVIEREGAAIGVLITLHDPTGPMKTEAAAAGFYESKVWDRKYPRLQLCTVGQLLAGKFVLRPPTLALDESFKRAPKAKAAATVHPELEL